MTQPILRQQKHAKPHQFFFQLRIEAEN